MHVDGIDNEMNFSNLVRILQKELMEGEESQPPNTKYYLEMIAKRAFLGVYMQRGDRDASKEMA